MAYRTDQFKVGDVVTWFDNYYATLTDGRKKHGDGPFTITEVHQREYQRGSDADQTNWESMGHTQHVCLKEMDTQYSGAFFKLVGERPVSIFDELLELENLISTEASWSLKDRALRRIKKIRILMGLVE